MRPSIFSKEDDEYMFSHYMTMSYGDIASHLGFSERQVRGHLNNTGHKRPQRPICRNYFDSINSKEKAYWLGFIYADGYIVCSRGKNNQLGPSYEVSMELQDRDLYILQLLNRELGDCNIIHHKESDVKFPTYTSHSSSNVLRVYSKQLFNGLVKQGIVQNKTYLSQFPHYDGEYFWHFLRGYFDGDGCLHVDKKSGLLYAFLTCSNKKFVEHIEHTIYQKSNIRGHFYDEMQWKHRLVYFNKNDVRMLLDLMYEDSENLRLERKYDIYNSYYGLAA